ncbi:MAG: translocation/assembly module TamB domain-containing protein [Zoogloeaceae bacterium]|jgi:translocation and assembly module TamB|nr:translocation/assembly module TamB domain-containing protein [Zoogloeaceae bacterium]
MKKGRAVRLSLLGAIFFFAALLPWLFLTHSGLRAMLGAVTSVSGGRLEIQGIEGRFQDTFTLTGLRWYTAEEAGKTDAAARSPLIRISRITLDWQPALLLRGRLAIHSLSIGRLELRASSAPGKSAFPSRLTLPLSLSLTRLSIEEIAYEGKTLGQSVNAEFYSDGTTHHLTAASFMAERFVVSAQGFLRGDGDFPIAFLASAKNGGKEKTGIPLPISAKVIGNGSLRRLSLEGRLEERKKHEGDTKNAESGSGHFALTLAPFSPLPLQALTLDLQGISPSRWFLSAPEAALNLRLAAQTDFTDGKGKEVVLSGTFALDNARAASWPKYLPAQAAEGAFSWRAAADDSESGQFEVSVPKIAFTSGAAEARLTFSKNELHLFSKVANVDPARILGAPPGKISGSIQWDYRFAEQISEFALILAPSQFANMSLAGKGEASCAPGHVRRLEIALESGGGYFRAKGALGRKGESLALDVRAPSFVLPGLTADFAASFTLAARAEENDVLRLSAVRGEANIRALTLSSSFADWAGKGGSLKNLRLNADVHLTEARAETPINARLSLEELRFPDQPVARNAQFTLSGTYAAHRLEGGVQIENATKSSSQTVAFPAASHLRWAARGGMSAPDALETLRWQGVTEELSWRNGTRENLAAKDEPLLALTQPTAVTLEARGLTLEAVRLKGAYQGAGWQAEARQFFVPFIPDADWKGEFFLRSENLAWLQPLLAMEAINVRLGGKMESSLRLSGGRDAPLLDGNLRGEALAIFLPESGLTLTDGSLRLSWEKGVLTLHTLDFTNPHVAPPERVAALFSAEARAELAALAASPGRLHAEGRIQADRNGQVNVRLEQFGVWQNDKQWLVLSGDGHLILRNASAKEGGGAPSEIKAQLEADLKVDGAYCALTETGSPQLADDVIVIRDGNTQGEAASGITAALRLDLGRRFYFSGAGLVTRLAGQMTVEARGKGRPPRAAGSIYTRDGRFSAYGQRLEIERGILAFDGLLTNPALNVLAWRREQSVEAGVELSGTARRPVLRLVSNPEVPDVEKLSWLILGEAPNEQGGGEVSALLAAAQALLEGQSHAASQLADLQRSLGVSVRVGSAKKTSETSQVAGGAAFHQAERDSEQVVRVGARLASGVTLSYEQSVTGTSNLLKLTFALGRRLSLIGQTGSENAFDIFYTFQFGHSAPRGQSENTRSRHNK